MPKFSVQICCYNSEKYLSQTIESVAAQTFRDWELVIVNDGSADATERIVKEYIEKGLPIVYHYQNNRGFASARNKAVELSKGEWIAILDHDDIWLPDKLEIQSRSVDRFPEAKLHFANSEWFTDDGKIVRKTVRDGKMKGGLLVEPFYRLLIEGCFIDSETVAVERASLLERKGFNEKYAYIVDYDLFIKMAEKYPVYYEDRVLAKWRMHPGQATAKMEEAVSREYVELFEAALKDRGFPSKIEDRIKRIMVYHTLNHSLSQLGRAGAGEFLKGIRRGIRTRPLSPRTYLKVLQTFCRASRARLE